MFVFTCIQSLEHGELVSTPGPALLRQQHGVRRCRVDSARAAYAAACGAGAGTATKPHSLGTASVSTRARRGLRVKVTAAETATQLALGASVAVRSPLTEARVGLATGAACCSASCTADVDASWGAALLLDDLALEPLRECAIHVVFQGMRQVRFKSPE